MIEENNKMSPRETMSIERQNLEAHVELCAERYNTLDQRIENLEKNLEKIAGLIVDLRSELHLSLGTSNSNMNNKFIAIAGGAIGILVTALIGFLLSKA
jgi:uncharacterized protein YdcH (DUF465 family)